ncbi:GTP-binding protein [Cyanobium sp. N5-Cardenillas]|uniref:GTP-binding protein n=1 Tax=Cyanobium sp. N5-Cardenillas TaxID=2823720 RepID=UPI0028F4520E|nr:GTP-binding protein [Cyanobium sp. N5-Cardenillas]MCP9786742.1 hypothetical protein [Cyanobium sp. N5-Cardenillas]
MVQIRVIVITSFLGAGKTTRLNRILSSQQGARTAVLVNAFGAIGIDNETGVATRDSRGLPSGCCCRP